MATFTDLTGKKFNRLTVIRRVSNKGKSANWHCVCDCGNELEIISQSIKEGHTKSCGCLHKEVASNVNKTHGGTSGEKYHPLYATWAGMNRRCYSKTFHKFPDYGGRGISVCDRWRGVAGFPNFVQDMGEKPKNHSLDRTDNNGNYCPENCRWADNRTQANNTRKNKSVVIDGVSKTYGEWGAESGVKPYLIRQRILRDGLTPKEAVFGSFRHWHKV